MRAPSAFAVIGLLLAGCTAPDAEDAVTSRPGDAPLLVPARLPDGYRWTGPDLSTEENGVVTARSSILVPHDLSRGPVAHVCVQRVDRDLCPHGEVRVERPDGARTITIALSGAGAASASTRTFWQTVPLVPAARAGYTSR